MYEWKHTILDLNVYLDYVQEEWHIQENMQYNT